MEFIDLKLQQLRIQEKIETNIKAVLIHGKYIMGPEVMELEDKLADFTGVNYAIGCASGTDALLMALMAYNIGPGDVIFTTPFTFIATAEVIALLGGIPVFVDIDSQTFNIDPNKLNDAIEAIKRKDKSLYPMPANYLDINLNPRGIIAVDLFGLPADYDKINFIAKEHNLFVIEDAAQSFGAKYKERKACALADMACTSFFPAKPLGCYGDGGMCFTDDDGLGEVIRSLRIHGKGYHKYDNIRIGLNGRLDTLQAAILLAKFDIFPEELELRRQVANRYSAFLTSNSRLIIPHIEEDCQSAWAQYSLLALDHQHRDSIQAGLKKHEIPTAIYYPKPLHLQSAFKSLGYKEGDFPISESYSSRIFSLPMHPYLHEKDQLKIAQVLLNESIQ